MAILVPLLVKRFGQPRQGKKYIKKKRIKMTDSKLKEFIARFNYTKNKSPAKAQPMKLQFGKRYIRRDGKITDPLEESTDDTFLFMDDCYIETYREDGTWDLNPSLENPEDLVAEYIEKGKKK